MMGDKGVIVEGIFAPGDQVGHLQNHLGLVGRSVGAHRLDRVLDRWVVARQAELAFGGVICQGGDRKNIITRHLVDQVSDARQVVGAGAALEAGDRVDDIGRRAAGHDQRAVIRDSAVEPGIASQEGK